MIIDSHTYDYYISPDPSYTFDFDFINGQGYLIEHGWGDTKQEAFASLVSHLKRAIEEDAWSS